MTWLTAIMYFLLFNIILRYPYIFIALVLLWVLRDRIPNFAELFRRRRRMGRLASYIGVNPHDFTARRDMGMLLLDAGRPYEALVHLEAAHKKDGGSAEINHLLGLALLRSGKAGDALGYLARAVELDPRFRYGESHLYLGEALLACGRPQDALGSIESFTKINSTSIEGQYFLARTLAALGSKDKASAAVKAGMTYHKANPAFRRRRDWRWYVKLKTFRRGL